MQALLVVESDKADMDVESFNEGILAAIAIDEGQRANVRLFCVTDIQSQLVAVCQDDC